ncbi:Fc receptor-like protein 5 [Chelmon rostratus]|uniref:Fc receptor-like protein 5 n=1 Tax=Chelmon rostratus TaxID=109905 RepID=UPI001BE95105|nr:Fc receptor-like protein 5 [Chelmon rostratus]
MEVAALSLLLLLNSLDSGSARVSLTVTPRRSQFFKYESFSVSCNKEGEEEEEMTGWRVMKSMEDGEVQSCPPPCSISTAFPATDSGSYWCETARGETSNTVNITVTGGSVILESPVLPVMEGDNVTLNCRLRFKTSACDLTADFYKDGLLIGTSPTGNMTLHSVSWSDEGPYKCDVCGSGGSPQSWLTVTAPPAVQDAPAPQLSALRLVRHLVVAAPYLISTILLVLIYRDRPRAQHSTKRRQTCNDVRMEMAS